jgi:hypothetical protein
MMSETKKRGLPVAGSRFALPFSGRRLRLYRVGFRRARELRTIAVPVFENASGFPEIDATVTQYVLREFQREGHFQDRLGGRRLGQVLGKLVKSDLQSLNYDRNFGSRTSEYRYALVAEITLVERGTGSC